ncbi:hypothetical protein OG883_25525 [Streptomyces sp. NBC_01142]|uniref:hypothetical protein n=1 Tax=Streptomyces sp. NBC_01142 TaxID=2975865 RepID=UPI00225B17A7|nr:hypothetical protein [Streptomyces sp. NBC_01142]MCX4823188.1 hypothetical protein [Streptomyces sp. NBC_01142]
MIAVPITRVKNTSAGQPDPAKPGLASDTVRAAVAEELAARRATYRRRSVDAVTAVLALLAVVLLTMGIFKLFTGPPVDAVPYGIFTGVTVAAVVACRTFRKKDAD